ncbi:type II secretion system F family protein [Paenibacillus lupini]|uniref:type II secretion system F family protein n=1 Tax=Paenibacillus lupini TaxID=1450204 RepID=UPI0014246525|nr:type II secretion system F family protein [Paenibacillus lupini]NIK26598.1 Flp pilus assembly protein TadB [Paenibacillus lupini]
MIKLSIAAAGLLLFSLLFIAVFNALLAWTDNQARRDRLSYPVRNRLSYRFTERLKRFERVYRHISELLETLQLKLKPSGLIVGSILLLLAGVTLGGFFFQSIKGTLVFGVVVGCLPYTILRAILVQRQMQLQMDFLPAIELFYQCYLVTGGRQVRGALQRTVEERRLLGPMQSVFEQLYRNLSVRGDDDASLRIFAGALGHVWGDYFINIMRVALSEGSPIAESLKELLIDMRKARRANEQERNKLLEIRIANFTPILFLAFYIGINVRYNRENSYYYYLIDPQGRDMLLNAVVLIFASFLMGLWLSRKKM